tara:strand:+ start:168 stop:455 length:288 start_codon:yes stop_codon:yes gene_type:complete
MDKGVVVVENCESEGFEDRACSGIVTVITHYCETNNGKHKYSSELGRRDRGEERREERIGIEVGVGSGSGSEEGSKCCTNSIIKAKRQSKLLQGL